MTNYATWMSDPRIQSLTMSELKLPGTHDSGTFSLTPILSQIEYPGIEFLWKVNPGQAPPDGTLPWSGGTYYIGEPAYSELFMPVVLSIARTQDFAVANQLSNGIRYFDLRTYYDSNADDFFVQHALRGCTLSSILQDVQQFIDANPTAGELIMLELSHTNFATNSAELTSRVAALLNEYVGPNLYMPAGAAGTNFDFQSLGSTTVGSITNAKPAVMALNTDTGYMYSTAVVNTTGFSNSGRDPGGVDDVQKLTALEGTGLQANPAGNLYQVNWTLTPQTSDVAATAMAFVLGGAQLGVQALAEWANSALPEFLQSNKTASFNLVTVDFFELPPGVPNVVDLCIALNTGTM